MSNDMAKGNVCDNHILKTYFELLYALESAKCLHKQEDLYRHVMCLKLHVCVLIKEEKKIPHLHFLLI